jgi:hypothetical protein
MKSLLTLTAAIETMTGLMMIAFPAFITNLLLGSSSDTLPATTITRIAAVAILAIGIVSWLARFDNQSLASRGLVTALIFYNAGVLIVLACTGTALGFFCPGLWLVVIVHALMTGWCMYIVLNKSPHING